MKYTCPRVTSTRKIVSEVKSATSNKNDPQVIDGAASFGSNPGYEADE